MSNYPFLKPGSTRVVPNPPIVYASDYGARTFVFEQITYEYVTDGSETLAELAHRFFGANSRHYRNVLRRQGVDDYTPNITIRYHKGKDN